MDVWAVCAFSEPDLDRWLDWRVEQEWFRPTPAIRDRPVSRLRQPFYRDLADTDGLKQYYDQLGHIVGDAALKQTLRNLKPAVRSEDTVARHNGDVFALLCPGLSREDSLALLNRLQSAATSTPLMLSYSYDTYPTDGEDELEILQVADQRLYQVKKSKNNLWPRRLQGH